MEPMVPSSSRMGRKLQFESFGRSVIRECMRPGVKTKQARRAKQLPGVQCIPGTKPFNKCLSQIVFTAIGVFRPCLQLLMPRTLVELKIGCLCLREPPVG